MKIFLALACLLLLSSLPAIAQGQPQPSAKQVTGRQTALATGAANQQSQIDSTKMADIRRLLDVTGAGALAMQTMEGMERNIKPLMTNSFPPGEYREKLIDLFFEKFHSKRDPQQLLALAVPVYDKYYSDDEIKQLIHLYETPLGQKMLSVMPKVMGELQEAGEKWGEGIGRQSMMEILMEHPDLQKALEDAKKTALPQ